MLIDIRVTSDTGGVHLDTSTTIEVAPDGELQLRLLYQIASKAGKMTVGGEERVPTLSDVVGMCIKLGLSGWTNEIVKEQQRAIRAEAGRVIRAGTF